MGSPTTIAAFVLLVAVALPAAHAGEQQLPNLVPDPPFDLHIGGGDDREGIALRFATRTANLSPYGFDVVSSLEPADLEHPPALQCIAWASSRTCTARADVGRFEFHPQHDHWHIQDYALYELRRVRPDGAPDMRPGGLVAPGVKASFCLLDAERVEETDDPTATFPFYSAACSVGLQGISAGWADVYGSGLPGQQVRIDDVADGVYALVITVNPEGFIREATREDNISWRVIELGNQGTKVRVVEA